MNRLHTGTLLALMTMVTTLVPSSLARSPAPVSAAVRSEMLVSTSWLAQHLNDPDMVLLCVSAGNDFYSKGHIPGARSVELSEFTVSRDDIPNELPPLASLRELFESKGIAAGSRIVIYGDGYGMLAARLYYTLDYAGLAGRAALLDGGMARWRIERRPESTTSPVVRRTQLGLRPNSQILVSTTQMKQSYVGSAGTGNLPALLDARPPEEFSGAKLSADVSKAGHIPGARGLYWIDLLVSRENPVLRPPDELRRIFHNAGATPERRVITYCRTGMQSSFSYFVAKYLGFDTAMYDSSFMEWASEELPVEK